jgi:flotillin
VEIAKAEAEKIKKIGAAEAYAIEGVGKAEAERMRMKAAVYKQYGDAAIMSLVLDALPKVKHLIQQPVSAGGKIETNEMGGACGAYGGG